MEPVYPILFVSFATLILYAVAATTMVRRNGKSPDAPWSLLRQPAWVAFAAAIVSLLTLAAAFTVVLADVSDFGFVQVLFAVLCVAIVGAFYLYLIHPLVKVLRSHRVEAARGR